MRATSSLFRRIILARLSLFVKLWGNRAYYRVLAKGKRWVVILIYEDDQINPADWERKAGE